MILVRFLIIFFKLCKRIISRFHLTFLKEFELITMVYISSENITMPYMFSRWNRNKVICLNFWNLNWNLQAITKFILKKKGLPDQCCINGSQQCAVIFVRMVSSYIFLCSFVALLFLCYSFRTLICFVQ